MDKKAKWFGLTFALIVVISAGIGLYAIASGNKADSKSPEAQQRAISEALQERASSSSSCAQVLTDAVHTKTGATYTFPDSCIPDDWEKVTN